MLVLLECHMTWGNAVPGYHGTNRWDQVIQQGMADSADAAHQFQPLHKVKVMQDDGSIIVRVWISFNPSTK